MDIKSYISSGIIEMYVIGICTPEEKAEIEMLRKEYPELSNAIAEFEDKLEKNLLTHSTEPGEKADRRILQTLKSLEAPMPAVSSTSNGNVKRMNWLKPVAAAAMLLFGASAVFNYILYNKTKEQQALLQAKEKYSPLPISDYDILKSPYITPVAMYGVGFHAICRCTMFWDKKTGKVYIMIHHLPQSSAQSDYQLWAMVNDKPVNIGLIKDEIRGRFIEMDNVPAGALSFIVTLEKAGGAASPTIEETYLAGKI
jgi:anti-sigma-K factor RskA